MQHSCDKLKWGYFLFLWYQVLKKKKHFSETKAMTKSYTLDCSCKCLCTLSYFVLKALFVLKIFKFLSWLLSHVGKWIDLKDKVSFRNLWRHNLGKKKLLHISPNISRSKSNQATKFAQLIEHNMGNIFLENS